ncbi:VOC family protein [Actinoplanes sp. M2I2]|uniref:VOC family protein n=1 Tax=Actinoplanes sp. M2I2 TaxID=1734444 RepID=UPI002021675B|nr:VOC family protein [Actinoplanes sp. M2I2]
MTLSLFAVTFGASRPPEQVRFWSGLLGRETADDATILPEDDFGFRIRFLPMAEPKAAQNRMHFDLTSESPERQAETVARALSLGARHVDIGQTGEEGHIVLADPEGNEFCVIEAGNNFLAGTGFIGALSCDGTRQVGCFWSEALGWPLVWDQDEETAVQSPRGGAKVTWGGPPLDPRHGPDRVHYDLAPPADGDQQAEVDRLLGLGATHLGDGHDDGSVRLADPDGTGFCVLTPRRA